MALILPATQLLDTGIDRLTIFGCGLVDVCVKFSGGAGQVGAGGVVVDVAGDGCWRGPQFWWGLGPVGGGERDQEPVAGLGCRRRRSGCHRRRARTAARATILLTAREPVHVVSQRLGHASGVITQTVYAHVLPGSHREAAERFASLIERGKAQ